MASSFRTAFVRVSVENNTQKEGVVIYDSDYFSTLLSEWSKSFKFDYWFILHKSEKDDLTPHFHFVIDFSNPVPFKTLKNKFPYGDIKNARGVKSMVRYLIHKDNPSKIPYPVEDVVTNSLAKLVEFTTGESFVKQPDFVNMLSTGELPEWKIFEVIPADYYIKNELKIGRACKFFRERVYMIKNREIKVVFLSGGTGTGKSGFVHIYCKKLGKSLCVSSSSNDPFQDYKGEDVLFLDDLKKDAFCYDDFLKILDPHYKSSSHSRYFNKFFLGDTIFIASSSPISAWYYMESPEDKKQLYRRVRDQYQFEKDFITYFRWNDARRDYDLVAKFPNYTLDELQKFEKIPNLDVSVELGWKAVEVKNAFVF
jgi:hypothetical protein